MRSAAPAKEQWLHFLLSEYLCHVVKCKEVSVNRGAGRDAQVQGASAVTSSEHYHKTSSSLG
jgi:hypothetical protein